MLLERNRKDICDVKKKKMYSSNKLCSFELFIKRFLKKKKQFLQK